MQSEVRPSVEAFFADYQRASNALDLDAIGGLFHDVFLNLDPNGVTPIPKDRFLQALPMREKMFGSIGAAGFDLANLTERPLDDLHTLVETSWTIRYEPDAVSTAPLNLYSAFLLRLDGEQWRIVLYLNHQDVAALIRARLENS
jgi:hypothetical protein